MNRPRHIRFALFILAFAFTAQGHASHWRNNPPDTITTRDGTTFIQVEIRRVTADAVVFFHANGAARILLRNLIPELQRLFGYDPEAASLAEQEEEERQAELRKRLIAEREAYYAAERERIRKFQLAQLRIEEAEVRNLLANASRPARHDRDPYVPFYSRLSEPPRPLFTRSRRDSYRRSSYHSHSSDCGCHHTPQVIHFSTHRPSNPSPPSPRPSPVRVQQGPKLATPAPVRGVRR